MKIVQSFYSNNKSIQDNFGWVSPECHLLSWTLSVHLLTQLYDKVELYTDKIGYDILINKLKLPYTNVHVVLDDLNKYPNGLWAIGKIKTYSLQKEPFIHVDGDVFTLKKFLNNDFEQCEILCQNIESITPIEESIRRIFSKITYIPDFMKIFYIDNKNKGSYNFGIFGGNDIELINKYCNEVFKFIEKNSDTNIKFDSSFNILFEQMLFAAFVSNKNVTISTLLKDLDKKGIEKPINNYKGLADFENFYSQKFIHVLGDYKHSEYFNQKFMDFMFLYYPELVEKVVQIIPERFSYLNFNYVFNRKTNNKIMHNYKNNTLKNRNEKIFARNLITFSEQNQIKSLESNRKIFPTKEYEFIEDQSKIIVINFTKNNEGLVDDIQIIILNILEQNQEGITFALLKEKIKEYIDFEMSHSEKISFNKLIRQILFAFIRSKIIYIDETK